eukprot:301181_1
MGQMCKVLFGLFFGVLAIICVILSFQLDEITRVDASSPLTASGVCGREKAFVCVGDDCDALIFGLNIDGQSIEGDNAVITEGEKYQTTCDNGGGEEYCDQVDAGSLFYYANIASVILGALGIILLILPWTRKATCGFYLFAAVCSAAAFAGFLIMSIDLPCWDVDNTDVEMASSCWFNIAGLALFILASIVTMGAKKKDDDDI